MQLLDLLCVVAGGVRIEIYKNGRSLTNDVWDYEMLKEYGKLRVVSITPEHNARKNYLVVEVAE